MANISKSVKLGVFTLAIMNVTAVVSLRGLPAEAEYGLSSAFYYLFAAIVFLIPTSLVAAELAAMFQDKQGGVFRWVGEKYNLVSYGINFRSGGIGIYRHKRRSRYVTGLQPLLLIGCGAYHLLACHFHFTERDGLGRKSCQSRRYGRHHHPGRPIDGAGSYLSGIGRTKSNEL